MHAIWNLFTLPFRAVSARLKAWEADRDELRRQGLCVDCREPLKRDDELDTCYLCSHSGF